MNERRKAQIALLILLLSCAPAELGAREKDDDGFNQAVKLVETSFHVKRKRSRLMGLARLGVKIARPKDVRNFRLAIFEGADFTTVNGDFGTSLRGALNSQWTPLAQVRSQAEAAQTYTYLREAKGNFKVLIVNIERREATVLEVEIPPEKLFEWLRNPAEESRSLADEAENEQE